MTPRSAADRKTQWNQVTKRYDCIVPNCDARVKSFDTYEVRLALAHLQTLADTIVVRTESQSPHQ